MKPVDVLVDELERKPAGELVQAQPAVRLLSLAWHRAPRARLLVLVYPLVLRAPRAPLPSVNTLFRPLRGSGFVAIFLFACSSLVVRGEVGCWLCGEVMNPLCGPTLAHRIRRVTFRCCGARSCVF